MPPRAPEGKEPDILQFTEGGKVMDEELKKLIEDARAGERYRIICMFKKAYSDLLAEDRNTYNNIYNAYEKVIRTLQT